MLSRLSTEDDRELGAPGRPRDADDGLSGKDVLRFGGASREKPGISEGFQGLDLRVGEVPRVGPTVLDVVGPGLDIEAADTDFVVAVEEDDLIDELVMGPDLLTDEDLLGGTILVEGKLVGVEGLFVGIVDIDIGFTAGGADDLDNGVEDLAGEDDRGGGAVDFEGIVGRAVGVEDLEGLDAAGSEGRPLGVKGLDEVTLDPPDDDGLLIPEREEFKLDWFISCAEVVLHLEEGSN